ncbi:MAG: hypothetical protein JJT75_11140 [Opitutales bacterium]|nr:hypothetical protein [Opitutales bacterium]
MKTFLPILLAGGLLWGLTIQADEPVVALEKTSINAGGGASESGDIVLHATLGQPVAGVAAADDTTLESGFWTGRLEVIVEYDNAFEEWMDDLPSEDKPPEGQQGPDDTPAGDGVSNLLKFAFGLMPLEPSADAMPTLLIDNEEDYLGLSFIRSADAEVTLKIYGSEDLDEWEEISHAEGVIEENLPGNREKVHLLTGLKIEDQNRYFFRLHVEVE